MAAGKQPALALLALTVLLSACGGDREDSPGLMNLRAPHSGPDEFAIMPSKPLQMPTDMANLPTPEPGGANLADRNPLDEAVVALGGRPGAGGNDAALVAAAGRHGVNPGIRAELAAEDAAFRAGKKPKLLERLFGKSTYHEAYSPQTTSPNTELERWRQIGTRTPSAPPPER